MTELLKIMFKQYEEAARKSDLMNMVILAEQITRQTALEGHDDTVH